MCPFQYMDALADIGVRQHGFCEWMSGLDKLGISRQAVSE